MLLHHHVGSFEGSPWEKKHRPESHLTCYPSSSSQAHISYFSFLIVKIMAPVQSLQQVSLYAEPVQSLSDVSDQLSHAALLIQRLHDRVQLLEELYRTVSEKHSYWGLHYLRNMNRVWLFFSDGAVGIERQSQSFIQTPGFTTLCTYYCMQAFCWSTFPTT